MKNKEFESNKKNKIPIRVFLYILCFPIWFPIIASILLAFFCIVFSFALVSVALAGTGILLLVAGIIALFIHAATGIAALGFSCIVLGSGALLFVITLWLSYWFRNSFSACLHLVRFKKKRREEE